MTAYLNRQTSGFSDDLWSRIDATAVAAARDILTARRILDVDGPYGPGLTSIEVGDENVTQPGDDSKAATVAGRAIAVPMLRQPFDLSIRRVEGHLGKELPLDLRPVEDAAEAVARREEELIYYGLEETGLEGLMTAEGRNHMECSDWDQVENAVNDVLQAVTRLDHSGFRGPYALALSPVRYNALFRRYEGSDMLQVDHLRRLCEGVSSRPPSTAPCWWTPGSATSRSGRICGWATAPTTAFTSNCSPARAWCSCWIPPLPYAPWRSERASPITDSRYR